MFFYLTSFLLAAGTLNPTAALFILGFLLRFNKFYSVDLKLSFFFIAFIPEMENFMTFPELSFGALNVNSLNSSTITSHHQKLKLYSIAKLGHDIIFLSDVRLKNEEKIIIELQKQLHTNPFNKYELIFNSNGSKRGVAILYKTNLPLSVQVVGADPDGNLLAALFTINGKKFVAMSVYGPNVINPEFFEKLREILSEFKDYPFVLGGDWNLTYSVEKNGVNLDVLNMKELPNIKHSILLEQITTTFGLTDPYRIFYPNSREFTFIPRDKKNTSRSRLDFFLISDKIANFVQDCNIALTLESSQFDHKAIGLSFKKKFGRSNRQIVSDKILENPLFDLLAQVSVAECYIHHINNSDSTLQINKPDLLLKCGEIRNLIRNVSDLQSITDPVDSAEDDQRRQQILLNRANLRIQELNISQLESLPLSTEPDLFLEVLLNCLRNDTISLQTYLLRKEKEQYINLSKNLTKLRNENKMDEYCILERVANDYVDTKVKSEFEKLKNFEVLNMEKITPFFLKLAKSTRPTSMLSGIKNELGMEFENEVDQKKYILEYYGSVYKIPTGRKKVVKGDIEKFLGPEILNHPLVKGSIIPESLRDELDKPLTINELDNALNKLNSKSAAGIDGFSSKFIKKTWFLLRVPLLNYSLTCFEKGRLTDNFRSACIRLIPKKLDATSIVNWRPISLLSNLYKVLSRALHFRLKKTTDIIFSRAQKGFTSSRFLQEVLINVIENIAHCKNENIPGAILSIDQSKAFDKIDHNFMTLCYEFFGFGNEFISMLDTVGTNRRACLIWDGGDLSEFFSLDTGRPQGEVLSPDQYNIGQQIALFKIELTPELIPVFQNFLGPERLLEIPNNRLECNKNFINESAKETNKCECFADDNNVIIKRSVAGIDKTFEILDDFGILSGLYCNKLKSFLIPIGCLEDTENFVSPVPVEEKFKILGMTIDNKLEKLQANFDMVSEKMIRTVNFWKRFRLTLAGRVAIMKTFLLSQVCHIGCFLLPSPDRLDKMQEICDNYCKASLRVNKNRLYLKPEDGGLGLVNLRDFLQAQQVIWLKRAYLSTRDIWRYNLHELGHGSVFAINPKEINYDKHPVLHDFAISYWEFLKSFHKSTGKITRAIVLNNPLFERSQKDSGIIDSKYLCAGSCNFLAISKMEYRDFWDENGFLTHGDLNDKKGLNLSIANYFRLRSSLLWNKTVFLEDNRQHFISSTSVCEFLRSFKKGSKKIREVFSKNMSVKCHFMQFETTKTFFKLTSIEEDDITNFSDNLGLWGLYFLPNELKEFVFKFYNNCLALNARIGSYRETTKNCSFCAFYGGVQHLETFRHFFLECEHVKQVQDVIESRLLLETAEPNRESETLRRQRWCGLENINHDNNPLIGNIFVKVVYLTVQYLIWKEKYKNRLPDKDYIVGELVYMLNPSCEINKAFRLSRDSINCPLSRLWRVLRRTRW